jgi:serine/threonine-protein kinase
MIDVVGYSKLLTDEQIETLQTLNRAVRQTATFQAAEAAGRLIRLPTGDGMALIFFRSAEEPAQCALEIHRELKSHPEIRLRMGIHSGPISPTMDVNDHSNVAGSGINLAQRVVDCGDAGHILLSKQPADDLAQYRHWKPYLYDLGECAVKHSVRLHLVSLCKDGIGNRELPQKLRGRARWKAQAALPSRSAWKKLMIPLLVVLLLAGAYLLLRSESSRSREKSIAVLPFENFSEENRFAHVTDAVQDEILTDLAKVADLKVISRTSVGQYRNAAKLDVREIARQLGVTHVVEGSVQCSGSRVRVTAQLIDARSDHHLWAERYDREVADVFALESEVAEKIATQLANRLSPQEKAAIEEKPTNDLVAYDLYARARQLIDKAVYDPMSMESLNEAVRLLEEAIAKDPSFPLAYYELAQCHDQIYLYGDDHSVARLNRAEAAIEALSRVRPDAGETHLARAKHYYWAYLDLDRARAELAKAENALPNDPWPPLLAGYMYRREGRWPESTESIEKALELDPRNPLILHQLSLNYECLRRYADLRRFLARCLSLEPGDVSLRIRQATVDLEEKADLAPLRKTLDDIANDKSVDQATVADAVLMRARYDRNVSAARQALEELPAVGCREEGLPFPKAWCQGVVEQMVDEKRAQPLFEQGRMEIDKVVRDQPNYAEALCVLGVFEAATGYRELAIQHGQRAVELLPINRDSINGALCRQYLALIYSWCGRTDDAVRELSAVATIPGYLSYGQLRLDPVWDPLRNEPRFETVVQSLAPK